jgi:hypothetical protein
MMAKFVDQIVVEFIAIYQVEPSPEEVGEIAAKLFIADWYVKQTAEARERALVEDGWLAMFTEAARQLLAVRAAGERI